MRRVPVGVAAGVLLLALAGRAEAQLSGTLVAELQLTTACSLSGENGTTGLDFGVLAFGTHPATFSGVLQAQAAGLSGNTQIVCSADLTDVTVTIDGGGNPGQGGSVGDGPRALGDGASNFVPYQVYASAGTTSPYPIGGAGLSIAIAAPGEPFTLPIFGRINKTSASALAAGSYTDTLQVTITF